MGGGDAEVDAIRTVVEEGRRRNRGRRGRNGRVDAEVDAVSRLSIEAQRVVMLDEEEAIREKTRRRACLSDDTGSGSSMTKTESAGRRPCADGWRSRDCASH